MLQSWALSFLTESYETEAKHQKLNSDYKPILNRQNKMPWRDTPTATESKCKRITTDTASEIFQLRKNDIPQLLRAAINRTISRRSCFWPRAKSPTSHTWWRNFYDFPCPAIRQIPFLCAAIIILPSSTNKTSAQDSLTATRLKRGKICGTETTSRPTSFQRLYSEYILLRKRFIMRNICIPNPKKCD